VSRLGLRASRGSPASQFPARPGPHLWRLVHLCERRRRHRP